MLDCHRMRKPGWWQRKPQPLLTLQIEVLSWRVRTAGWANVNWRNEGTESPGILHISPQVPHSRTLLGIITSTKWPRKEPGTKILTSRHWLWNIWQPHFPFLLKCCAIIVNLCIWCRWGDAGHSACVEVMRPHGCASTLLPPRPGSWSLNSSYNLEQTSTFAFWPILWDWQTFFPQRILKDNKNLLILFLN